MKVFTAALGTETNTFSPIPTNFEDFENCYLLRPGEHPDHPLEFTAPLWIARERASAAGWQLTEGTCTFAPPAGITKQSTFESLRDEIISQIEAALPLDMIALSMHGAMVAESCDDCEGDMLQRIRNIAGNEVVIGLELDPHCHLSEKMLHNSDAIVMFKEYPHTDFLERAHELLKILEDKVNQKVDPVMSVYDCHMISTYHTTRDPMKSFVQKIKVLEKKDGILSISIAHGFPWADVSDIGTKILVITDGNPEMGAALAKELGQELFSMRGKTFTAPMSLDQGISMALSHRSGTVIVADTSDNPGGGAPGDSTFILSQLLDRRADRTCLGPLWDPTAVRAAFTAGVGTRTNICIGGRCGPTSGKTLCLDAEITALCPDAIQSFAGSRIKLGDCAAIRVDGVDIVLSSLRNQALGLELFTNLGIDPSSYKVVVVKSSQHFCHEYGPIADKIIYTDSPGAMAQDFTTIPYTQLDRPLWPLITT